MLPSPSKSVRRTSSQTTPPTSRPEQRRRGLPERRPRRTMALPLPRRMPPMPPRQRRIPVLLPPRRRTTALPLLPRRRTPMRQRKMQTRRRMPTLVTTPMRATTPTPATPMQATPTLPRARASPRLSSLAWLAPMERELVPATPTASVPLMARRLLSLASAVRQRRRPTSATSRISPTSFEAAIVVECSFWRRMGGGRGLRGYDFYEKRGHTSDHCSFADSIHM
ncbi:hypothetical protein CaCOL14_012355 [Colletotrichum acutatum]